MQASDSPSLEAAMRGFSRVPLLVKSARDSRAPLGYCGIKIVYYQIANHFRLAVAFWGMSLDFSFLIEFISEDFNNRWRVPESMMERRGDV